METSLKDRSANAVAQLYIDLRTTLLKYIRSKINSKEDGEDILQNVFVRIAEQADSLTSKDNIKNWLFIITRNTIIDYYRSKSSRKITDLSESLTETLTQDEANEATQGLDQCLAGFIDLLPETYKSIMIDSELKEVKQKELAEKYHMAYSSLRSRVQRGRQKVKQQLLECCQIEKDTRGNIIEVTPKKTCTKDICDNCDASF